MTTAAKDKITPAAETADAVAHADAELGGRTRGRQTFVLGIFPEPAPANQAVRSLTASPARECDVLIVSDAEPSRNASRKQKTTGHVSRCPADTFLRSGIDPQGRIEAPRPFRALWESIRAESAVDLRATAVGAQRLFQHVVNRLSGGATLLVVRTENLEQRLATSRALLEANCEVLLTHEIAAPFN